MKSSNESTTLKTSKCKRSFRYFHFIVTVLVVSLTFPLLASTQSTAPQTPPFGGEQESGNIDYVDIPSSNFNSNDLFMVEAEEGKDQPLDLIANESDPHGFEEDTNYIDADGIQANADEVFVLVRKILPEESIGGFFYEGDVLHVAVTNEEAEDTIFHHVPHRLSEHYVIHQVRHNLQKLEEVLRLAIDEYEPIEASIDIQRNGIELGFEADRLMLLGREESIDGVDLFMVEAEEGKDQPLDLITMKNKEYSHSQTAANSSAVTSLSTQQYELWGGDTIGRSREPKATLTLAGTWDGKPAVLIAGHTSPPGYALQYFDVDGIYRMTIGFTIYSRANSWESTPNEGDYAIVARTNGIGTNKILTGTHPISSEQIRSSITRMIDIPPGKMVWRYGQTTRLKSLHTIERHVYRKLHAEGAGFMQLIEIKHVPGRGVNALGGDSGGPVWISYEYNYLVGLCSGSSNTLTIVYPYYDLISKTGGRFELQTSP